MLEWLKSAWERWKVQVSVIGGVLVVASAYGTCTYEPPAEAVSEAAASSTDNTTTEATTEGTVPATETTTEATTETTTVEEENTTEAE